MVDWDALTEKVHGAVGAVFGENGDRAPAYYPASGGSYPLAGAVFDAAYSEVLIRDGAPVQTTKQPVLGVQLSQLPAEPLKGDRVFVPKSGLTYIVHNHKPDGHGWTLLYLAKTA